MSRITIQNTEINVLKVESQDYISLTDMAKSQLHDVVIIKWLSLKNTIEYLGEWEKLYNPNFNYTEFGIIKNEAGNNSFVLSAKHWIEKTNAIAIVSKTGRYGGTFAHKDIAFHFGMWISPKFQLLLVKEFQRLKEEENKRLNLDWNLHRTLTKVNYRIHTNAIKQNLIPQELTKQQIATTYTTEADILNMAIFGKTAQQWRNENNELKGNLRDNANINELICLSNLENLNALFIAEKIPKNQRLVKLNEIAIY